MTGAGGPDVYPWMEARKAVLSKLMGNTWRKTARLTGRLMNRRDRDVADEPTPQEARK
ncbi:MAG: hypothetical protein M4579_006531, partial [Chaenotheca gracillima]